jgi:hypothetical protein
VYMRSFTSSIDGSKVGVSFEMSLTPNRKFDLPRTKT